MYFLYDVLGLVVILFSPIIILLRIISGKEDPKRFMEKFCVYKNITQSKKTIWIHGASIGEILSILPIVKKLERNRKITRILITSSTTSSANIISKYKFKKTIHKYFPIDTSFFSIKFINNWKPEVAIFVESEIWPNMFKNLYLKKIPIILLNARITKKSFNNWSNFPNFSKSIFKTISLAMPQNLDTEKYLKILGVKKIKLIGNLKYFGEEKSKLFNITLKKKFIKKNIWCAASTHQNEEVFIGKVHKKLKLKIKNLLTIIIPRHINRTDSIINDLKNLNLKIIKHSSFKSIKNDTDIYLVDTYGESSMFYAFSNVTFLGGSLVRHGGQNPLEPARLGNYIVHGSHIQNFKEVYTMLRKLNISSKVDSVFNMQKIIFKKISHKQSKSLNQNLFSIGKKILIKNLFEINKYI
tara:strand:+ start:5931 stop:7166 length:1236 start_codon:yes stop_codon:yes gene_type:complete